MAQDADAKRLSNIALGLEGLLRGFDGPGRIPPEDIIDMSKGATIIADRVTDARRAGQKVEFVQAPTGWYWQMPDGSTVNYTGSY